MNRSKTRRQSLTILSALLLLLLSTRQAARTATATANGRMSQLDNAVHAGHPQQMYAALYDLLRYDPRAAENAGLLPDFFQLGRICDPPGCRQLATALLSASPRTEDALNNALRYELLRGLNSLKLSQRDPDSAMLARVYPRTTGIKLSPVFNRLGPADIDLAFAPEKNTPATDIIWQPAIPDARGSIRPAEQSWPRAGIVYLRADLAGERPFLLRLDCNRDYNLIVNGREVLRSRKHDRDRARTRWVHIDTAGAVTLLLKMRLTPGARVSLQELTTNFNPRLPRPAGANTVTRILPAACKEIMPPWVNVLRKKSAQNPNAAFALALWYSSVRSGRSLKWYRRGSAAAPAACIALALADRFRLASDQPQRVSAQTMLKNALAGDPDSALLQTLSLRQRSVQPELLLQKARSISNSDTPPLILLHAAASVFASFQVDNRFRAVCLQGASKYPGDISFLIRLAEFELPRNPDLAAIHAREALNRRHSLKAALLLARALRNCGNPEEARKALEPWNRPPYRAVQHFLAEANAADGKVADARRDLLRLISWSNSASALYDLIALLRANGEPADMYLGRLERLDRALADKISGRATSALCEPWRDTAAISRIIAARAGAEHHENDVLRRDFIFRFYNDGRYDHLREELVFVKDSAAVTRYGNRLLPYNGEIVLLVARVYLPDGTSTDSYTMLNTPEGTRLLFENLQPGSLIHLAWEVRAIDSDLPLASVACVNPMPLLEAGESAREVRVTSISSDPDCHLFASLPAGISQQNIDQSAHLAGAKSEFMSWQNMQVDATINPDTLPRIAITALKSSAELTRWFSGLQDLSRVRIKADADYTNWCAKLRRETSLRPAPWYNMEGFTFSATPRGTTASGLTLFVTAALRNSGLKADTALVIDADGFNALPLPAHVRGVLLTVTERDKTVFLDFANPDFALMLYNPAYTGGKAWLVSSPGSTLTIPAPTIPLTRIGLDITPARPLPQVTLTLDVQPGSPLYHLPGNKGSVVPAAPYEQLLTIPFHVTSLDPAPDRMTCVKGYTTEAILHTENAPLPLYRSLNTTPGLEYSQGENIEFQATINPAPDLVPDAFNFTRRYTHGIAQITLEVRRQRDSRACLITQRVFIPAGISFADEDFRNFISTLRELEKLTIKEISGY